MGSIESKIHSASKECLRRILGVNECLLWVTNCREVTSFRRRYEVAGLYVFFDDDNIYYVGETNNMARRVGNEHCDAHIGGSEGVVRFLMYYLEDIYGEYGRWRNEDAKGRENIIKEILRERIRGLKILIITCDRLKDVKVGNERKINSYRRRLEDCLIKELKPILNY